MAGRGQTHDDVHVGGQAGGDPGLPGLDHRDPQAGGGRGGGDRRGDDGLAHVGVGAGDEHDAPPVATGAPTVEPRLSDGRLNDDRLSSGRSRRPAQRGRLNGLLRTALCRRPRDRRLLPRTSGRAVLRWLAGPLPWRRHGAHSTITSSARSKSVARHPDVDRQPQPRPVVRSGRWPEAADRDPAVTAVRRPGHRRLRAGRRHRDHAGGRGGHREAGGTQPRRPPPTPGRPARHAAGHRPGRAPAPRCTPAATAGGSAVS